MRRSPGFAITTVVILALGITADIVVFGVLQALILQPLDVPHPDRLMHVALAGQTYPSVGYPEMREYDCGARQEAVSGGRRELAYKLVRPGLVGDQLGRPARGFLAGVMGLAGIVLLAACANLGGLFATRTAGRKREIAIRMAIGPDQL